MGGTQMHMFGGDWTQEKLDKLRQYLAAYMKVMKKQPFELAYIDAFAGTGYVAARPRDERETPFFPELADQDRRGFLDGSAAIALQTDPPFDRYVFVEKIRKRFRELSKLKDRFSGLADRIDLVREDCNAYVRDICESWDWRRRRAVLFLDPFGMQVEWETIEAIAATKAIDLWVLFPLGVGVNRLLRRDGAIPDKWRRRLDLVFGTTDWYDVFYEDRVVRGFFGSSRKTEKLCNLETIAQYYNERLRATFADVADNPLRLCNKTGNPLFLLCFAASNERGAPIAKRIAQHILKG